MSIQRLHGGQATLIHHTQNFWPHRLVLISIRSFETHEHPLLQQSDGNVLASRDGKGPCLLTKPIAKSNMSGITAEDLEGALHLRAIVQFGDRNKGYQAPSNAMLLHSPTRLLLVLWRCLRSCNVTGRLRSWSRAVFSVISAWSRGSVMLRWCRGCIIRERLGRAGVSVRAGACAVRAVAVASVRGSLVTLGSALVACVVAAVAAAGRACAR